MIVGKRGSSGDWSCSGADLEHLYFIHSVSLLGRLLLFERGRQLFPISIIEDDEGFLFRNLTLLFLLIVTVIGLMFFFPC